MRITNIQPQLTQTYNRYQTKPLHNQTLPQYYDGKLPSTQQYLAFTGGYSLDLAQTVKQLDKLAKKNSNIYPPHIREWIDLTLEEGSKKTLIGVHKDYFSSLKDCFSLDKIKEHFTEFEEVVPAMSIKAKEGSLIDKFQKRELEFFDNDEDLSVQLIKLYWGEGFSLNDLKRYAGGQDLYQVMKRLQIPTASRDYGHYLKFSDPQYNERLTAEMTAKRLEALDRRAQMQDGEPVYIKRGPLSPEHRQHISEGLIRFYQENPERIYAMSERQKAFYAQNPEKSEELKRVLTKAWSMLSAENIKKSMSKFFKAKKISMFNLENPEQTTATQSRLMREFWGANPWAKKTFSKNMTYAWKKVKEENEAVFILRLCPDEIKRFVEKKEGVPQGSLDFDTRYNPYLKTSSIDEASAKIFTKHTDIEGINNLMADTYQMSIFHIVNNIQNLPKHKKTYSEQEFEILAKGIIYHNKDKNGYKIQTTDEARNDFIMLAQLAAESKDERLISIVNQSLNDAFKAAKEFHNFILK